MLQPQKDREARIKKQIAEDQNLDIDVVNEIIENFDNAVTCGHMCTSRCGNDTECNCDCGDMHID